jgi:uncharacterized protein (TIGR00369 family)
VSWEQLLEKTGSFKNLIALARKTGTDVEAEVQKAMSLDSALFGTVGYKVEKIIDGMAVLSFSSSKPIQRRGGIIHGGIIMYTLDNVCGLAVMTVNPGTDQLTMELKVNFLEPLQKGPFKATGRVLRAGRTVAVAEGEVRDADNVPCAKSLGTWYMIKKRS